MRFPEFLFRLLPGDQGSQQLGVIWRQAQSSQSAVDVGVTIFQVPADKCLVLTNAAGIFQPGGAQTVDRGRLFSDPPEGTERYEIASEHSAVAGGWLPLNWAGEVIIPGGWKVRVEGTFSAAAAANVARAEIHGYLIPRGTFIFG